ncbi:PQQ-dependent sugar dehydrogenase [Chryseolinea sp. H1M3-3]|uniref:PQQ-dependent sugar dehydrogenase n=1 Tax=Chryseolinea sp. H1M3-3 TaxID=3034144 RepID=UPI0023ED737B|nr:PQQ-dependent sugar dehydrogenase [Chryseolinea sp. H1M3-3]
MIRYVVFAVLALGIAVVAYLLTDKNDYASDEETLVKGKNLFTKNCMSCHSLEGDGIGPPLGGVTNILSRKDLTTFIKNPAQVIEAKGKRAVSLLARYKQVMPPFEGMQDPDIHAILSYIHHQTEVHNLQAVLLSDTTKGGLTGRLVQPIKQSPIKIELEQIVQIPRKKDASPDLGIVTLRAHPSGDGSLFVGDQNGTIYSVRDGKHEIFLDIRAHVKDFQSGPGIATGVGSFDFHPDFLNNGLIYITHAETYKGQRADYTISDSLKSVVQWVISEWKMDNVNDKVFRGTHREMLRLHAPNFAHGCQEIAFIPGLDTKDPNYGLLYIGYGDGGSNNIKHPELGHHLKSFLGTVMRIDPAGNNSRNGNYGIPADNPFVHETDPAIVKEIYALGFRNPHRLSWDPTNSNRMMVTDIGEANVEELNIVEKGGDYGWPNREGTFGISTLKDMKKVYPLGKSDRDLYKKPFVQYDHEEGNAIDGGHVYEGELMPLKNKYVFGDIVNGKLFYINIDPHLSDSTIYALAIVKDGKATTLQEMFNTKRLHQRIAYDPFKKDLYVITKADGKIWRVSKAY